MLGMNYNQQSVVGRITDRDKSRFADGMVGVIKRGCHWIVEDRYRLIKRYAVLLTILRGL